MAGQITLAFCSWTIVLAHCHRLDAGVLQAAGKMVWKFRQASRQMQGDAESEIATANLFLTGSMDHCALLQLRIV